MARNDQPKGKAGAGEYHRSMRLATHHDPNTSQGREAIAAENEQLRKEGIRGEYDMQTGEFVARTRGGLADMQRREGIMHRDAGYGDFAGNNR